MENSKIELLLQSMTIEEKLAQMTQLSAMFLGTEQNMDLTGPLTELNITEENLTNIGSTLTISVQKKLWRFKNVIWKKTDIIFLFCLWLMLFMGIKLYFRFHWP